MAGRAETAPKCSMGGAGLVDRRSLD